MRLIITFHNRTDKQMTAMNEDSTYEKPRTARRVKGDGSRVKFDNGNPDHVINLHRPHPDNRVKHYAVKLVTDKLKRAKLL